MKSNLKRSLPGYTPPWQRSQADEPEAAAHIPSQMWRAMVSAYTLGPFVLSVDTAQDLRQGVVLPIPHLALS